MAFVSNLGLAFQAVASKHAARMALHYPQSGEKTTYSELARMVDKIARQLAQRGFKQGDVGAIFHDKSPAAFATMLACLRLGIVYTNLDPDSPWERLRKILATCQPRFVINAFPDLAHSRNVEEVCEVIDLAELTIEVPRGAVELPALADISGSTPPTSCSHRAPLGFLRGL